MNTLDFGERTKLWLDRLACGELDEPTRTKLFAWLDAEPLRWRECALACLESQTWNEALGDSSESKETLGQALRRGQETRAELPVLRTALASRISTLTTVAALLLVAFGLGAFSRGWLTPPTDSVVENPQHPAEAEPSGPLMATVSLRQGRGLNIPATLQIPVMAVQNSAAERPASSSISEYERQKWERRGYQLIKERRFLPAELPGGKKVVVPVEQIKASYVGSRVS
ncbi:MAG: hypothetical protein ACR2FY_26020 [Pirellulaceae bacterium]